MIEIKGFLETSFSDWPGKLCSVIFLPHCNFRCPYCHNHPLIFHPEQYSSIPLEDILNRLHPLRHWIDGVCLTGGEPTLHPDLPILAEKIKREGFLVKLDTNGSNPYLLEYLVNSRMIDFIAMDVKAPLNLFHYSRAAGVSINLDSILKSIEILKRGEVDYQFRMTVVPKLHQEEDIQTLGHQLRAGQRFILQPFNPENPLDPSFKDIDPYGPEVLKRIQERVQTIL